MPYKSKKDINPALKGIHPPISLAQANEIASQADAIGTDEKKNGWAIAIANFKKTHIVKNGKWVSKKKSMGFEDINADTNNNCENEIEQKWLVALEPPQDRLIEMLYIEESYASINPVVRIRKIVSQDDDARFFHAVKYRMQGNLDRFKIKTEISEDDYILLLKWIDKKPIEKYRYIYDIGNNLQAKLDRFSTGQVIVEVEFPSIDVLKNFVPPMWFGTVLDKNVSISEQSFRKLNGIPEEEKTLFSYSKIDSEALW